MENKIMGILSIIIWISFPVIDLYGQTPHLSGKIEISVKHRTLSCNLNYDHIPEGYELLLNQAFKNPNIKANDISIRTNKKNNSENYVDAVQYELPPNTRGSINLVYEYRETRAKRDKIGPYDWKGNLAFNHNSIRASEQTVWYPIWYNPTDGVQLTDVKYDLEISCNDCSSIFLNGSLPQGGQYGTLSSDKAVPLLLFAGNFDFDIQRGIALVNSPLKEEQDIAVIDYLERVKAFYASKIHMSIGHDLTIMSSEPTSADNAWLFATYPTIAIIGTDHQGMKGFFKEGNLDEVRISSLAHEVAHYYIGNVFQPRGPLFWVLLEGVTEYLSLQANRHIFGDAFYDAFLEKYKEQVQGLPFLHLSDIGHQDEVSSLYRYAYVPLLLTAIEKEIGNDSMWLWIQQLISYKDTEYSDYAFFKKSFIQSGLTENTFTDLETKFINGPKTGYHIHNTVFP
ncbi:M1 family metallopeptidase [Anditalea andensis]|nr:M1 family metallopeptidase [Anditalea andensis]